MVLGQLCIKIFHMLSLTLEIVFHDDSPSMVECSNICSIGHFEEVLIDGLPRPESIHHRNNHEVGRM